MKWYRYVGLVEVANFQFNKRIFKRSSLLALPSR